MICNGSEQQGVGVLIIRTGCAHVRIVKYLDDIQAYDLCVVIVRTGCGYCLMLLLFSITSKHIVSSHYNPRKCHYKKEKHFLLQKKCSLPISCSPMPCDISFNFAEGKILLSRSSRNMLISPWLHLTNQKFVPALHVITNMKFLS